MMVSEINLIDGEKGGIGKSLMCKVLIEYLIKLREEGSEGNLILVDADRSNPDVGAVYFPRQTQRGNILDFAASEVASKSESSTESNQSLLKELDGQDGRDGEWDWGQIPFEYKQLAFSEDERRFYDPDWIFEAALSQPSQIVVNLPAQIRDVLNGWIEQNNLIAVSEAEGVQLRRWFICTGERDSVELFVTSVQEFEGKLPHILVRNMAFEQDWEHKPYSAKLNQTIEQYSIPVVDLPKLSSKEADFLNFSKLPFRIILEDEGRRVLGLLGQSRVRRFLDLAYSSIDGVFKQEAAEQLMVS